MDNTNITKLCREDFDKVFDKLISPSLKFKTDIQTAMASAETMTMQDIYRKMALTVNFLDFNESGPVSKKTVLPGKSEMGQWGWFGGQEGLRQDFGSLPLRTEDQKQAEQAEGRHETLPLLAEASEWYAGPEMKETSTIHTLPYTWYLKRNQSQLMW